MEKALRHTFERVKINPERIALGGLSYGASYVLALGCANGELFTHLFNCGTLLEPLFAPAGQPRILVAHGTRDYVYNVWQARAL